MNDAHLIPRAVERAGPTDGPPIADGGVTTTNSGASSRCTGAAGKAPGFLTPNEADARRILEIGAQFVAVGSELGTMVKGVDALAAKFKG